MPGEEIAVAQPVTTELASRLKELSIALARFCQIGFLLKPKAVRVGVGQFATSRMRAEILSVLSRPEEVEPFSA